MKDLWRVLGGLYRAQWRGLLATAGIMLLALAAGAGLLGVAGWFLVAAALAGAGTAFNLFVPSALVRALAFTRIGSRYGERLLGHAITLRMLARLRVRVFAALSRLSPGQLAQYRNGDLVARLIGDIESLDPVFLGLLGPLAAAIGAGTVLVALLGTWLPPAALIVAALLGLCALGLPAWLWRGRRAAGQALQRAVGALRAGLQSDIDGHAELLALGATPQAEARFARLDRQAGRARLADARAMAAAAGLLHLATGIAVLTVLWFALPAMQSGRISPALAAGLLFATFAVFEAIRPLLRSAAHLGSIAAAAGRIGGILDSRPALRDPARPRTLPPAGVLQASGLHHTIPGQPGRCLLDGASLSLAPGQRIAITGPSGAGKSTLLRLLMRIEDPDAGTVRYGGIDLRDVRQRAVHARIALLSQDTALFLGTIRSNLQIGDPRASEASMWRALGAARLAAFVRGLPRGLDTWIGESGARLSAGEARRLCLARVLLGSAQVLLLDEPTAGLDAETAQGFLADLAQATEGRSVVLVTHGRWPEGAVERHYRLSRGRLHPQDPNRRPW